MRKVRAQQLIVLPPSFDLCICCVQLSRTLASAFTGGKETKQPGAAPVNDNFDLTVTPNAQIQAVLLLTPTYIFRQASRLLSTDESLDPQE